MSLPIIGAIIGFLSGFFLSKNIDGITKATLTKINEIVQNNHTESPKTITEINQVYHSDLKPINMKINMMGTFIGFFLGIIFVILIFVYNYIFIK